LTAFLLALALRLLNAGSAFVGGLPRFSPLDELYHAKRIAFTATQFPRVLDFDPDRGTHGAWCPWPPLYDLAAGGYARLLGASTLTDVMPRVVWLPPFLFALFVAAATFLVARARGALTGALAGLALASSPFLVDFSSIGSIDHHFLEPALTFALVFALVRLLRGGNGIPLGLAMAAAMFVQTALLLACAIAFAVIFFGPLFLRFGQETHSTDPSPTRSVEWNGMVAFAILTLLVGLYAATRPPGYPSSAWFLGWPHVGIFAGATMALLLRARRAPALLALLAGVVVIATTPTAIEALVGGSQFLGGDPWLRTISEFLPVITEPPIDLLSDLVLLSGGIILVWPLAVRSWRTRDIASGTIALFAILYLLLELSSRRFRPQAISLLALAGALEAGHAFAARRRPLAILCILLVALPPPIQLLLWLRQPGTPVLESQLPWLRAASFFQRQTPGGRVLAPWSMGHLLDVVGERPVIVDNFGSMPDPIDFERAHDALLSKDEASLAHYCDANNIRWIVFANPVYEIPEAAAVNGIDARQYVETAASHEATRIHRLAQATCWWRAYYFNGAARPEQGMFGTPLSRFRKVYSDPQLAWHGVPVNNGPALQIWERVRS
jgi:asparagine N-glycosylation enzyme membrane subunit Stt3